MFLKDKFFKIRSGFLKDKIRKGVRVLSKVPSEENHHKVL